MAPATSLIHTIGFALTILAKTLAALRHLRTREVLNHIWTMGVGGTAASVVCLTFLCVVMILELSFHMALIVRQDAMVPSFAAMLLIRELGPVVTAILLASRVGAAMGAELSTLVVTGQIDALQLSGIDVRDFLVVPRVLGCLVASIGLTVLGLGCALIFASIITASGLGMTPPLFLSHLFLFCDASDLTCCLLKAAMFGLMIPIVSCYYGLNAQRSSRGVGEAATLSVVHNSVTIIAMDFLVSWLWYTV